VRETLPGLDERATRALALAALAGRSREEIAGEVGDDVGETLARGRKALRRSLFPLPGSGWCERAERLISDRMDDALLPPGPARLEVHLRNCDRCVEHERRLAQATDLLVASFVERHPAVAPEPEPETEPAEPAPAAPLRVVEPPPARAEPPPKEEKRAELALMARARVSLAGVAWSALLVIAVLLTLATVAITVLGILGGQL
jgi:putative zinc finger protein